jgi:uroporphyrinogen-III synthase
VAGETPSFNGRRVLVFESRRAREIEALVATFGGVPVVAPAMRETPMASDDEVLGFARSVIAGAFDAVVFLTGVGVRALADTATRAGEREAFIGALGRTRVITRGPKPVAALRELQVPVWANAPEPNTWRELVAAVDAKASEWTLAGSRVAVQEYGVSNTELLSALRSRGAEVTAVQAYQWEMPEDLGPLGEAARELARGTIDVVLITTGVQLIHFWRVVQGLGLEAPVRTGLGRAMIASIGPSASAEIRRHGFEPAFEPSHPKMGLLVREAAERVA